MEIRQGIGVSPGFAIGSAFLIDREDFRIERRSVPETETEAETERFDRARESAAQEIALQLSKHAKRLGPAAEILRAHITLLRDEPMREEIFRVIRQQHYSAEYAISRTVGRRIKTLSASGHLSFVQRVLQDLTELEKTLLRHLLAAKREDVSHLTRPVVIVSHNLGPAQTLSFDRTKILGMITEIGGRTSHTAIVASSLGIPAVVGVEGITGELTGGDTVILDGSTGKVIVNPDEATRKRYQAMDRNFQISGRRLTQELHDLPAVTKDGHAISILANIETPDEIQAALDYGAEGIGLYRTEYLFLQNGFQPSEQVHLDAYRRALAALGGRKLVIRTLDLGADKMPLDGLPPEANPFMGTRAIRLCFERPDIFKVQIRAIFKTAAAGNVHVMYPMISSLVEIEQTREIVREVRRELQAEGVSVPASIPTGIMVEVPSAAILADVIAREVDFLSIGTNDLIAYAMAVDRGNERIASLYQPAHPAILRLLRHVIEAGEKAGKPVSVCGEMSSDVTYTLLLLGLGLKTFSVVPPAIPEIKKVIRSVTLDEARNVMNKAFEFGDARRTSAFLREETMKILPDAF